MRRAAPFFFAVLTSVGCASEVDRSGFTADDTDTISQGLTASCPPVDSPEKGPVQGIDISQYQTVSDWNKLAGSEDFVILKATQGATSVDPKFSAHRAGARGTKITLGYYHYLNFTSSGAAQADNFLNAIGNKIEPDELPPMLDVEDSKSAAGNSKAANLKIVVDWLAKVEAAVGKKPLIYTGGGFWGGASFGNPPELAGYFFCWARYSASNSCPQVPENLVGQIKMWQYRADAFPGIPAGNTAGINGAVDQDVFYGDAAAFKAFVGGSAAAKPAYAAKYFKQSYPFASQGAAEVKAGQVVTGFIEMTNVGEATWKPGKVFLAPIPRDQGSPYRAPSWKSETRIATVDNDVAPGEVGHFDLDLSGETPGEGTLKLGWVAEGETWFADGPTGGGPKDGVAEVAVKVLPGDPKPPGGGGSGGTGGSSGAGGGKAASGTGGATAGAGGEGRVASAGSGGTASGAAGRGGRASAGGKPAGADDSVRVDGPAEEDGCGCRTAPVEHPRPTAFVFLLAGALLGRRRSARALRDCVA